MSKKYFVITDLEKNKVDRSVDSFVFFDSWNEDCSKEEFELDEKHEVIYVYELKEVHRRKKGSNGDVGVKEVWI